MQVREAMAKTITTVDAEDPITKAAEIMKQQDTGFIPVTHNGSIEGVITDRDIVVRCLADGHDIHEHVENCMSRDIKAVDANSSLEQAARIMSEQQVRRLAVVENDRLVGVLSHGNLVQATGGQGPAMQASVGITRGA